MILFSNGYFFAIVWAIVLAIVAGLVVYILKDVKDKD